MQKKEREGMDRGGKRKYIKIRQLEEKLSQKRREPTGCKYIGKYIKQDLVVVSVLVGAQLLVNVSGLQLRYSNVNRIAAESVYMKLTDTHETGIGKLCAAQNAEVEKMVKNLTETKLERMMAVKELPVVEEIPVSRKTMSVPDVHWIKASGESEGISSEESEIMIADNVIAVDGNLEKTVTATKPADGAVADTTVADTTITDGKSTDVIPEDDADTNEAHLTELVTIGNFAVNKDGIIEKCIDPYAASVDDTVILPTDERCTGIGAAAFDEIIKVSEVMEVYIPANITYIETEALEKLNSLIYIEVAEENPEYESIEGILYDRAGNVLVYPAGREEDV